MKKAMFFFLFPMLILMLLGCQNQRGLVVGKIQKASKLSTTEFTVDKLVFGVKNKRILWVIKLNQAQFLAQSQAIIKAGIDLEKIQDEDITIEGKKISLTLPPVEIINFSYPAEKFKEIEFLSSNVFAAHINLEDQEKFFQDAEIDIRNSLQYMGIVEATQTKTRALLVPMLENLGYDEIYIDFKQGDLIVEIGEGEGP
jgi:hypothetical protein